ncbi:MAG: hypothetical protein OEW73_01430 [Gammaproteobacteria bacterium]|nr:hypothetical protein [Gammaproteobacteria bacterium]MDH5239423.1 hypothetical protein [Gammaproteobacteria bacterium]MDH5260025.1 hypothetical protein [Gammaproteobacteria bacterium]MDH5582906.1 hypothetical protein [Gammaproteobacteria bacterium]
MLLRRLAEALSQQNWFVVIIEVLVVVVGIFIGLQVDDWNTARKDRIDERAYLQQLHSDVLFAEELSSRVRARRLERLQYVLGASDVLAGRRDALTKDECIAVASSNFFNINAPALPSLDELISTGRLEIIQDAELRRSLIGLQQTRAVLQTMIEIQTTASSFAHLPSNYPDLIRLTTYFDEEMQEIRAHSQCDLDGMRSNQGFLNQWSANADGYDAFIQDGLEPWSTQFDKVHALIDDAISIKH